MKPKRLAESAERAPHTHPDPVPPSAEQSPTPSPASPDRCHYQGAVLTRTTSTNTGEGATGRAGFDPLRGVTRLQPYLRAGPRQLKPALGGK